MKSRASSEHRAAHWQIEQLADLSAAPPPHTHSHTRTSLSCSNTLLTSPITLRCTRNLAIATSLESLSPSLGQLPAELVVSVLLQLSLCDAALAARVCRRLAGSFRSSAHWQRRFEQDSRHLEVNLLRLVRGEVNLLDWSALYRRNALLLRSGVLAEVDATRQALVEFDQRGARLFGSLHGSCTTDQTQIGINALIPGLCRERRPRDDSSGAALCLFDDLERLHFTLQRAPSERAPSASIWIAAFELVRSSWDNLCSTHPRFRERFGAFSSPGDYDASSLPWNLEEHFGGVVRALCSSLHFATVALREASTEVVQDSCGLVRRS